MATTQEVREAIAAQLLAANPNVNVYAHAPDNIVTPALIVVTGPKNYDQTMARGIHRHEFNVMAVAGRVDARSAQDALDAMCDATGDQSVPAAIDTDRTFDGLVADASVSEMSGYGPVTIADIDYLKADFTVVAFF